MLTDEELRFRHTYQRPTEQAAKLHDKVNTMTGDMAIEFEKMLPEGREKALVHTSLEVVRFWANNCIAHNHDKL